jgi:hypothetical protein
MPVLTGFKPMAAALVPAPPGVCHGAVCSFDAAKWPRAARLISPTAPMLGCA